MITRVTDVSGLPDVDLQALGAAFVTEARAPGAFKPDVFKRSWVALLQMNMGALWTIVEGGKIIGALGAIMHPDINDGEKVAQEAFWFVDAAHRGGMAGIRLLNEFEMWAAMHGAKRIMLTHLSSSMPEKLKMLYERRGFRAAETNYIKAL